MTDKEIEQLSRNATFENRTLKGKVEQTHISWVILSARHAFKIKKPVKLSFVDFSSLAKRKNYCETELTLNKRFSAIYLAVLPVRNSGHNWQIGDGPGKIVDYAVVMKRMRSSKRMDKVLKEGNVKKEAITSLAKEVAIFHSGSTIINKAFDLSQEQATFNDIKSITAFVKESLGRKYQHIIERAVTWSDNFLKTHARHIQERIHLGFRRDVHGDLHSGNIFLYKKPVIFDCIEFNPDYRQIDVLYEIAFLCMDLEAFDEHALSDLFKTAYARQFPCFLKEEDHRLFVYYKCMRANIRSKVNAIAAQQESDLTGKHRHIQVMKTYLQLVNSYLSII